MERALLCLYAVSMEPLLKVRGVSRTYGTRANPYPALRGLDLDIRAGEFVGIMGPSGAGKTTLLNLLATIDQPDSGTIEFEGRNLATLKGAELGRFRRDRLGFIFQDFHLLDTLSVEENLALPLALAGRKPELIRERTAKAAAQLGLTPLLLKRPYELSGGQKQRVAAARAIVSNPGLVLADEPTGNLDSRSARELLEALTELNAQGTTLLLVTHDAFAASWCQRIVFLKDGTVFGELVRGDDRQMFFDRIIDSLRALEGGER